MNGSSQPSYSAAASGNTSGGPSQQQKHPIDPQSNPTTTSRMSGERNGAVPMPVASPQRPHQMAQGDMPQMGMGAMPRSPPKNKNTSHVPCKFFLQSQCQAGRMCPFSHDIESSTRPAPCKYFAKGGCKFGRKCALLHISPDGQIMNRMPPAFQQQQQYIQSPQMGGGYAPPPPGLLSMQAQGLEQRPNGEGAQDFNDFGYGSRGNDVPQFDMTYTSASPKYGSPAQSDRFATSPPHKGLSVLDAPLPSSFDSSAISMAAINGPHPASVPSRFGLESPPSSLPRKAQFGNTTLRDLHSSAFGDRGMDGVLAGIGSSPPSGADEPLTFPKRSLHSERFRASRPIFSASLGTRPPMVPFEYSDDEYEEGDSDREEDLLPASLRDLIPEGKLRRGSKNTFDDDTPAAFLAAQRRTISTNGTPSDRKLDMAHSASPSRYTSVFASGQFAKSEVGSPLRNSGFSSVATTTKPANGELSTSISSPPQQASMSMLTQGLQRTKLDVARSQAGQAPVPIRTAPAKANAANRKSLDRGASATSVSKIDEEQELFDMDEISGPIRAPGRSNANELSTSGGAWSTRPFGSSPGNAESAFGAIGSHRNK